MVLFTATASEAARSAAVASEGLVPSRGPFGTFGVYHVPPGSDAVDVAARLGLSTAVKAAAAVVVDQNGATRHYLPDRLTVQLDPSLTDAECRTLIAAAGSQIVFDYWTPGFYDVTIPAAKDLFQAIRDWYSWSRLLFAEPAWIDYDVLDYVPTDPRFSQQWHLKNTSEADIQATDAWDITKGSSSVLIVTVDSGLYLTHEDLQANLLDRNGEDWDFYCNGAPEFTPNCDQVPLDNDLTSPDESPPGIGVGHGTLRNDGAEIFTDVTAAPLGDTGYGSSAAWADYDNDGDIDLYLVKNSAANKLYRNEGAGTFTEITTLPLGDTGPGAACAWIDYDSDGWVDIYLVNRNAPNKMLRNLGCGSFVDATTDPLGYSGPGSGVACGDYDGDADQDIYLINDGAGNKLFRNDGAGSFTDVTPTVLQGTTWGQGADWGDYDNDGDQDLLLVSRGGNRLYRNEGGGSFTDATTGSIDGDDNVRGGAWLDYDSDRDLDIYISRDGAVGNSLLRNDGNGVFADATAGPLGSTALGRGVAAADYDRDGDIDLYLTNSGASSKLFRNHAASGKRWLRVKLVGKETNRSAIGARVRVVTGSTSQIREVSGGQGYKSQGSLPVEFGLGTSTLADLVEVRWPGGVTQTLTGVSTNQALAITECGPGTPSVIETTMQAWSEGNPDPSFMTLHFTFQTTLRADEFEVQYRPVGGSWQPLVCSTPSATCIFACAGTYERTTGYTPCEFTRFEWRAKAKNCNGWAQNFSAIKTFDAYCLQEP
jgi:hypothetical protein